MTKRFTPTLEYPSHVEPDELEFVMEEGPHGQWVRYEDYAVVVEELRRAMAYLARWAAPEGARHE